MKPRYARPGNTVVGHYLVYKFVLDYVPSVKGQQGDCTMEWRERYGVGTTLPVTMGKWEDLFLKSPPLDQKIDWDQHAMPCPGQSSTPQLWDQPNLQIPGSVSSVKTYHKVLNQLIVIFSDPTCFKSGRCKQAFAVLSWSPTVDIINGQVTLMPSHKQDF